MRKIKDWNNFLLEYVQVEQLKYYIFDIDDNLLRMDTPLHFQHFEDGKWVDKVISPAEFADVRKKYPTNYMDNNEWKGGPNSFSEFRDFGPRGENAFLEDVKKAISKKDFAPSWETFLKVLKEGKLFAIVTTRGHEPQTLKNAVRYIIENVLTDEDREEMKKNLINFNEMFGVKPSVDLITQYLNECYFIGLNSKAFEEEFHYRPAGPKLNQGKQDAINKFVNYVRDFAKRLKKPLKIGFSDDDIHFSTAAKELFMGMEKSLDFPENFYVFDTSDRKLKGGVKVKI